MEFWTYEIVGVRKDYVDEFVGNSCLMDLNIIYY
jgi:hypothetical protein